MQRESKGCASKSSIAQAQIKALQKLQTDHAMQGNQNILRSLKPEQRIGGVNADPLLCAAQRMNKNSFFPYFPRAIPTCPAGKRER
jgi:hypothetical protein